MVLVNGIVVRKPETKIQEQEDVVMFSGKEYRYEAFVYYMLHKPAGVISATEDRKDKTVLDLIPDKKDRIFFQSEDSIRIRKDFCS